MPPQLPAPALWLARPQTILHTGDFRWQPSMAEHPALKGRQVGGQGPPPLLAGLAGRRWQGRPSAGGPSSLRIHLGTGRLDSSPQPPTVLQPQIDCLMLDTTYAAPRWAFPPQADAVAALAATLAREAEAEPGERGGWRLCRLLGPPSLLPSPASCLA